MARIYTPRKRKNEVIFVQVPVLSPSMSENELAEEEYTITHTDRAEVRQRAFARILRRQGYRFFANTFRHYIELRFPSCISMLFPELTCTQFSLLDLAKEKEKEQEQCRSCITVCQGIEEY